MTEVASDILAEVAARYGVGVAADATVQRIAAGVSAEPLPVWDGKALVYPDWKARVIAAQGAQVRAARKGRALRRAETGDVEDRLRAMHAEGARVPAMAEAFGRSADWVYGKLSALGLRMARDPAQYTASAARMVAARIEQQRASAARRDAEIAALARNGAGVEAIGAALGLTDADWLRRLIRRAVPGYVFPARRRGPPPRPKAETAKGRAKAVTAARRAVHVARNARILDLHRGGATMEELRSAAGVSRTVVARVLRAAGEAPRYAAARESAARVSALPEMIAQGLGVREIAARWGVTESAVHTAAHRAGVSLGTVRPPPHNKGKMSARVAARREWIAAMVRRGATDAEMLRVLGIHGSTLSADIAALGLSGARPRGGDRRAVAEGRAA